MSKTAFWSQNLLHMMFDHIGFGLLTTLDITLGGSPGNFYISLHTADPGVSGDQSTNETTYGGYARVLVGRADPNWEIGGATFGQLVENSNPIAFNECISGSSTVTHFGIGTAATGAGTLLYRGTLTSPTPIGFGSEVEFAAGNLNVTEV